MSVVFVSVSRAEWFFLVLYRSLRAGVCVSGSSGVGGGGVSASGDRPGPAGRSWGGVGSAFSAAVVKLLCVGVRACVCV